MRKLTILAATLASLAGSAVAVAQTDYPSRPITMIVPFAAGGPTDVISRIVTESMSRTLGQQIVIEKDRVVGSCAQQLHCFSCVMGDINDVAFEARCEPAVASHVVIQKKNTNRMTLGAQRFQAKFCK